MKRLRITTSDPTAHVRKAPCFGEIWAQLAWAVLTPDERWELLKRMEKIDFKIVSVYREKKLRINKELA